MPEVALFPLQTVLFPAGPLPLRIFEPRYLDMVSRCLRQNEGFGVCLTRQNASATEGATYSVGTLAHIVDWGGGEGGLLHILVCGGRRFRVLEARVQENGLDVAEIEWLDDEPATLLPEHAYPLADLLRQILTQVPEYYRRVEAHYDDASWVGYRLAELLPLSLPQRQYFLELEDPVRRLEILRTLVDSLAEK